MLKIENLCVFHKRDMREIIKNLSLMLNGNEKVAIVGEEGNGKSTLLRLLYDANSVEYAFYTGKISCDCARKAYLEQETSESAHNMPLYEYFGSAEGFYDRTHAELFALSREIGTECEWFYSDRRLGDFSGGEKVKLRLLRALITAPDMLFLDEPSNDLDAESLIWLENFISNSKIPILYVSHDEALLEKTSDVTVHLEMLMKRTQSSVTVFTGGWSQYVTYRRDKIEKQTRIAEKERDEWNKKQARLDKIYDSVDYAQSNISRQDPHGGRLLKKKMKSVKSMEKRFEKEFAVLTEIPDTEEAIGLKFPEIKLPKGKQILDAVIDDKDGILKKVRLSVCGGDRICITGKNGAGKSTLLKLIYQTLSKRPDIKIGYMPQNYCDTLPPDESPIEFLVGLKGREKRVEAERFLGSAKFSYEDMKREIRFLSGGQRAKLQLIKLILFGAEVLLLDEPTRNLSPLSNPVLRNILSNYSGTVIAVSHDRKFIADAFTKEYVLENGILTEI